MTTSEVMNTIFCIMCLPSVLQFSLCQTCSAGLACLGVLSYAVWMMYSFNDKMNKQNSSFSYMMLMQGTGLMLILPLVIMYPKDYYTHLYGFWYLFINGVMVFLKHSLNLTNDQKQLGFMVTSTVYMILIAYAAANCMLRISQDQNNSVGIVLYFFFTFGVNGLAFNYDLYKRYQNFSQK